MLTEAQRAYNRQRYRKNKDQYQKRNRAYYLSHRQEAIDRTKAWRKQNPEQEKQHRLKANRDFHWHLYRMWLALVRRLKTQSSYIGRELEFDKEWFLEWGLQSPDYKRLHSAWVASNYERKLVPTLDRINNNRGYLKRNIRFLTSSENARRKRK